MDCGSFKVQRWNGEELRIVKILRFTKDELDKLIDGETNAIFYPGALLDTKEASDYWFLVEEHLNARGLTVERSVAEEDLLVNAEVKRLKAEEDLLVNAVVEHLEEEDRLGDRGLPDRAIQLLAMHDWTPEEPEEEFGVHVDSVRGFTAVTFPFQFVVHDDVLSAPTPISPMPEFDYTPADYSPEEWTEVSPQRAVGLTEIVHKGQKLLEIVNRVKPYWDFVAVAMGYLGKAFSNAPNLEQLLWNIAVLEALLSDKAQVRQSMRRRISNILGESERERGDIRKKFNELYNFRSDLVHGNMFENKWEYHHLGIARDFARRVFVWFTNYLIWVDENFRKREISYERYPRRDELLAVLDLDKASLNRLSLLIGTLPEDFPKMKT